MEASEKTPQGGDRHLQLSRPREGPLGYGRGADPATGLERLYLMVGAVFDRLTETDVSVNRTKRPRPG
jgi:hypothetical protein